MPTERKFYKTVIQVEVLSEEPFEFEDLEEVRYEIKYGECSGKIDTIVSNEELDGPTTAKALIAHASEPEYFGLDKNGNDAVDVDEDDLAAHDEAMKNHYEDGECPDCGEPIPDDAVSGSNCSNCDHVFTEPRPND